MELDKDLNLLLPRDFASAAVLQNHTQKVFEPLIGRNRAFFVGTHDADLSGSLSELMSLPDAEELSSGDKDTTEQWTLRTDLDIIYMKRGLANMIFDSLKSALSAYSKLSIRPKYALLYDVSMCSKGFCRVQMYDIESDDGSVTYQQETSKSQFSVTGVRETGSPSQAEPSHFYYEVDAVFSYRCSEWPLHMRSVFSRRHNSGWPDAVLLNELLKDCLLIVSKADPLAVFPIEYYYRFSFSLPERTLSRSLSDPARHVYLCTKLLCKFNLSKTGFKTYFLKTQMFWFVSRTRAHMFEDSQLAANVRLLLQEFQESFNRSELPHFFIPEMNLLTSVSDVKYIALKLYDVLERLDVYVKQANLSIHLHDYRLTDASIGDCENARGMLVQSLEQEENKHQLQNNARLLLQTADARTPVTTRFLTVKIEQMFYAVVTGDDAFGRAALRDVEEVNRQLKEEPNELARMNMCRFAVTRLLSEHAVLFAPGLALDVQNNQPVYIAELDLQHYVVTLLAKKTYTQQEWKEYVEADAKDMNRRLVLVTLRFLIDTEQHQSDPFRKSLSFKLSLLGHALEVYGNEQQAVQASQMAYRAYPHQHLLERIEKFQESAASDSVSDTDLNWLFEERLDRKLLEAAFDLKTSDWKTPLELLEQARAVVARGTPPEHTL